jgi:hypothetical protein
MDIDARRIRSPGFSSPCSPEAVTVDADDGATANLALERADRCCSPHHFGYVPALLAEMIKLEDPNIDLPAVRTRMHQQVVGDKCSGHLAATPSGRLNLTPVQGTSLSEIRAEAVTAPPLTPSGVLVEAGQRKITPATATLTLLQQSVTVAGGRRLGRGYRRLGFDRDLNVANPQADR